MQRSDFSEDFVWGTATAAYQIEGAVQEDGRGPSIWDTFSRKPGAVLGGDTGDIADDHYHRFREDVALMADLGVNAYRFSIAWTRVQPTGSGPANQAGIDFYRRLADTLGEHGITPWATLYHWDLPQTLEDTGGWLRRDTALRFAEYAGIAVDRLGDAVSDWITLNEPWCSAFLGYASGHHAPGRHEGSRSLHAAHHLLLGHGHAMTAIRAARPDANAGITLNLYSVRPASGTAEDVDAARRIDGLSNRLFLDPVLRGQYPQDVLNDAGEADWFAENATAEDLALISAPIDFLGINYYSRHTVAAGSAATDASAYPGSESAVMIDTGAPRTQMGWEIHPHGMLDVLEMAHERAPELPLYITENGSAYEDEVSENGNVDDPDRLDYLRAHIDACRQAIERGLPLAGYFVWSLMDNFEWAWGYHRRFGIVHVDYDTQVRTPKASGMWFSRFLGGRIGRRSREGVDETVEVA
ncbi:GH1 family beta-glucosidase [Microbacterium sp. DT81.1]|uniref:GH1 family beta-glucosidase n=1 Tax=Microbacterium sp. DT81.1 TaxID=3393413 RepID=UPI003CF35BD2